MIYWNRDYLNRGILSFNKRFLHLRNNVNVSENYIHPAYGDDRIIENDEVIVNDSIFLFDGLYFYFDTSNNNSFEYDVYYFAEGDTWNPLTLTLDETNNWTQDGKIEFDIPEDWTARDYGFSEVGCGFCIKFVFKNVTAESKVILSSFSIRNLTNVIDDPSLGNTNFGDIYNIAKNSGDAVVVNNFRNNYKTYDVDYGVVFKSFPSTSYFSFSECHINLGTKKKPGAFFSLGNHIYGKFNTVNFLINTPGFNYFITFSPQSEISNTNFFMNQSYSFNRLNLSGTSDGINKTKFDNVRWNGYGNILGKYLLKNSKIKPIVFGASVDCDYENVSIERRFVEGNTYQSYRNLIFDYDGIWQDRTGYDGINRQYYAEIVDCHFPNNNEYNITTSPSYYPLSSTSSLWKHTIETNIKTNTFQPIQGGKLSVKDVNGFDSLFIKIDQTLDSVYYDKEDTVFKFSSDISTTIFVNDILLIQGELIKVLEVDNINQEITVERGLYWSIPHRLIHYNSAIYRQTEFIYSNEDGSFNENILLTYHTRCTGTDGIFIDKEEHLSPFTIRFEKEGFLTQENIIETVPNMKIYFQMGVDLSQEIVIVGADTKVLTRRLAGGVENG